MRIPLMDRHLLIAVTACAVMTAAGQERDVVARYRPVASRIVQEGLRRCETYDILKELATAAPHRLAGSPGAAAAVRVTADMMRARGFAHVRVESCMVPHWERGPIEEASFRLDGESIVRPLTVCALGGSIGTPGSGISAEVVEVKSVDELKALGDRARGKIVFFNRPMDPSKFHTFEAYGGAVDQRAMGAVQAAHAGGVAALVRSMTLAHDDVPHTGSMNYVDSVAKVPAAAISTVDADILSVTLRDNPTLTVTLRLSCKTYPDAPSGNVVGEVPGSQYPDQVVVVGGHLDAWDKGQGVNDDATGCAQAIAAVNLIKRLGLQPKRTIRAVMFMNEENGSRGGIAYAQDSRRATERHVAAIESDAGGFAPRGFGVGADSTVIRKVQEWKDLFAEYGAGTITPGGGGVDIGPLMKTGVPGMGLVVENHRYFDYHHSDNDTIDTVNARELEMGTAVLALMAYLISEEGL